MKLADLADGHPVPVLLAEDNEDDVTLIREALSGGSLISIMDVVRDGDEALAYLRRQGTHREASRPALILLDINLPKKNGFEVLQELKRDDELRRIPVVMLTGSDRMEDISLSYAGGASSFIIKPVDFEAFERVIQRFAIYWSKVVRLPSE